jgi:PKD repeat protein
MTSITMWSHFFLRAVAVVASVAAVGCGLTKQEAPPLAGPSEFGESISVAASPDRLSQDGASQARVVATIRDHESKPKPNVVVQWSVTASAGVLIEPSSQQSVTDAQGQATMFVTAPTAPVFVPTSTQKLTITARTVGADALSTSNARTVEVLLIPPAGTLLPNRLPVASFSVAPAVGVVNQSLRFDASLTTDEGEPCGDTCTYSWDFGDYETASGKVVSHSYSRTGTFTVWLTVVDPRGGVGSTSRSVTVTGPAPPVANFTVSPASPKANQPVVFNASATTVGLGATITSYEWDFGDGSTETTTVPGVTHTYAVTLATGTSRSFLVVLKVTDSFGQTSTAVQTVTVVP